MALVTISGYPCSGKTTRARELAAFFEAKTAQVSAASGSGSGSGTLPKFDVVVVDDEGCHVTRAAYDDSKAEKPARAALFTAGTRSLNSSTITILDSANYIKGFRYQLYCAAREAGVRVATIRIATPPHLCEKWHAERAEEDKYKQATFENLIMRYEEPSSMVRWDSPLFTIACDEEPPYEEIWAAITTGEKKKATAAVAVTAKPKPGTLQTLTTTTSTIVTSLLAHLNAAPDSTTFLVPSPPALKAGTLVLRLPHGRRLALPEMQRHKRAYEAQQTLAHKTGSRGAGNWTEGEVAAGFVTYLETAWETNDL